MQTQYKHKFKKILKNTEAVFTITNIIQFTENITSNFYSEESSEETADLFKKIYMANEMLWPHGCLYQLRETTHKNTVKMGLQQLHSIKISMSLKCLINQNRCMYNLLPETSLQFTCKSHPDLYLPQVCYVINSS